MDKIIKNCSIAQLLKKAATIALILGLLCSVGCFSTFKKNQNDLKKSPCACLPTSRG